MTQLRSKVNSTIAYKLGLTKFSRMLKPSVRDFFVKIDIKRRKMDTHFLKQNSAEAVKFCLALGLLLEDHYPHLLTTK